MDAQPGCQPPNTPSMLVGSRVSLRPQQASLDAMLWGPGILVYLLYQGKNHSWENEVSAGQHQNRRSSCTLHQSIVFSCTEAGDAGNILTEKGRLSFGFLDSLISPSLHH